MLDLRREEALVEREEELEIQQKRDAAHRLALQRGLSARDVKSAASAEIKAASPDQRDDGNAISDTAPPTAGEEASRLPDPTSAAEPDAEPVRPIINEPGPANETDSA